MQLHMQAACCPLSYLGQRLAQQSRCGDVSEERKQGEGHCAAQAERRHGRPNEAHSLPRGAGVTAAATALFCRRVGRCGHSSCARWAGGNSQRWAAATAAVGSRAGTIDCSTSFGWAGRARSRAILAGRRLRRRRRRSHGACCSAVAQVSRGPPPAALLGPVCLILTAGR